MISCFIVDDELHAIQILARYIEQTPGLELLGYCENPLEALDIFRTSGYAGITFVDVDLPQLSGIDLSDLLRNKTSVVFATAYDKYAIQAFEKDALDYILKPITYDRFLKCINKLNIKSDRNQLPDEAPALDHFYIQYESKGKIVKIVYNEVIYIEALKNYIVIHTTSTKYIAYLTMKEMEESMPSPMFIRVHKSAIINLEKMIKVEGNAILFENKTQIILGASYRTAFFKRLNEKMVRTKRSNNN